MLRRAHFLDWPLSSYHLSPLRETVLTGIAQAAAAVERYSPYSYAAVGLVLVGLLMLTFYKASVPR